MFRRERTDGRERGETLADGAILRRIADGDQDAMRDLYRRYGGPLYAMGLRSLRDPGLAEDMVQETFVRLWRAAARFDHRRGTPQALIFTVGRRVAIDLGRRRDGRETLVDERAIAAAPAPGHEGDDSDATMDLMAAVEGLSPPHREVISLAYVDDLSQSQIAERIGVPVGTVKTRTFHALRSLRESLGEETWRD